MGMIFMKVTFALDSLRLKVKGTSNSQQFE